MHVGQFFHRVAFQVSLKENQDVPLLQRTHQHSRASPVISRSAASGQVRRASCATVDLWPVSSGDDFQVEMDCLVEKTWGMHDPLPSMRKRHNLERTCPSKKRSISSSVYAFNRSSGHALFEIHPGKGKRVPKPLARVFQSAASLGQWTFLDLSVRTAIASWDIPRRRFKQVKLPPLRNPCPL